MGFGGRGFLFMGVLLALPLASYWYVFRPQNTEIDRARKEIEQKEQMLKKLEFATSQTADLERTNKEIAEAIGASDATVERDWKMARAWLIHNMAGLSSGE